MKRHAIIFICLLIAAVGLQARELVYQDAQGVIRWTGDDSRVALYGANYCLPSACDYRAAGYVDGDRDAMIAEDLDHFVRMGWDGLRLCFWGDWQNTDAAGNLIDNDHLRLLDRLIDEATRRNIYMLLSPIVTYNSQWPEMTDTTNTGFMKTFSKADLILDPVAKQAQKNYIVQLLNHTNRYTGRKIKDEPNILFIEVINEPTQFPDKPKEMADYINGMVDAIRSTGCEKLTFYNVSQNFKVAPIVAASKVDGGTYAWYPNSLNNHRAIEGNQLLCVDRYEQLLDPVMKGKSRIVYEFDATDRTDGIQVPAMVREFVRGGCQFMAMFSYDMLRTAPQNLGWETHFVNMVYTPRKAVASMIAAEIARRMTPGEPNPYYPANCRFGDFRVSNEDGIAMLNSGDMYYHTGNTADAPKDLSQLRHIAGVGSSPMVDYAGNGIYFIDREDDGSWTLDLYPDIIAVSDAFDNPSPYKQLVISDCRERDITVSLPGLGKLSGTVYPGKYRIDRGGITRIADHPQQEFYAQYKGWPSPVTVPTKPDCWNSKDWYTTVQPTDETADYVTLLDAGEGTSRILYSRNFESPECSMRLVKTLPGMNNGYELTVKDLTHNPAWRTADDVTLSHYCGDRLWNHKGVAPKVIKVWAKGLNGTDRAIVNFVDKDGRAFGAEFPLTADMKEIEVPVSALTPKPAVVLPQDWPGVCDYYYPQSTSGVTGQPDWDGVERVQVSLRGELYDDNNKANRGIVVEKIVLGY